MVFKDDFGKKINEMAESIIAKNNCETPLVDSNVKKQMQSYALSAVIYYHAALREELIDSGIDIGELKILSLPDDYEAH